jgi:hypothetical protein
MAPYVAKLWFDPFDYSSDGRETVPFMSFVKQAQAVVSKKTVKARRVP